MKAADHETRVARVAYSRLNVGYLASGGVLITRRLEYQLQLGFFFLIILIDLGTLITFNYILFFFVV